VTSSHESLRHGRRDCTNAVSCGGTTLTECRISALLRFEECKASVRFRLNTKCHGCLDNGTAPTEFTIPATNSHKKSQKQAKQKGTPAGYLSTRVMSWISNINNVIQFTVAWTESWFWRKLAWKLAN
jgi:predicted nucleotidyltransferase component of viral defense system